MSKLPYVEKAKVWNRVFNFNIVNEQGKSWYGVGDNPTKWNDWDVLIKKLIKKGDTVLDVGANQSWTSLVYAKWVGANGTVCAIEADEENCRRIHDNIAINKNINIGVFHNVIDSISGLDIPFTDSECVACGWYNKVQRTVKSIRIDDFIEMKYDVDFIKIDVEGYEHKALLGAEKMLSDVRPFFEVEMHTFKPNGPDMRYYGGSVQKIFDIFHNADYRIYCVPTVHEEGITVYEGGMARVRKNSKPDPELKGQIIAVPNESKLKLG